MLFILPPVSIVLIVFSGIGYICGTRISMMIYGISCSYDIIGYFAVSSFISFEFPYFPVLLSCVTILGDGRWKNIRYHLVIQGGERLRAAHHYTNSKDPNTVKCG